MDILLEKKIEQLLEKAVAAETSGATLQYTEEALNVSYIKNALLGK